MKKRIWTAEDVHALLEKRFAAPAHALLSQVRNGVGFQRQPRTADAVAVSLWPSRGLWFAGVEIKVSRSDWQAELRNPRKAAAIQQWCNYWWIAAPKGVVDGGELPETWGLLECSGRTMRCVKDAPRLDAKEPDVSFVCAILRNVAESTVPIAEVQQQIAQKADRIRKDAESRGQGELKRLRELVERFEESSGVSLSNEWDTRPIGEAVAFVRAQGATRIARYASGVQDQCDKIKQAADELASACELLNKETKNETPNR